MTLKPLKGKCLKILGETKGARIGVIFQGFNLVSRLSVFDNIASGMLHNRFSHLCSGITVGISMTRFMST